MAIFVGFLAGLATFVAYVVFYALKNTLGP